MRWRVDSAYLGVIRSHPIGAIQNERVSQPRGSAVAGHLADIRTPDPELHTLEHAARGSVVSKHCRPEATQMHVSKRELNHAGSSFGGEAVALLFGRYGVPEDSQLFIVGPRIRVECRQPQAHGSDELTGRSMLQGQK